MSNAVELVSRAMQMAGAGRVEAAESLLRSGLAQAPADAEMNRALGALLRQRGLAGDAAECLKRAADASPKRPELWYELGMCLAVAQRLGDSVVALERALQLAPQAVQVYELLGQVLAHAGEHAKACRILMKGLRLQPQNTFMAQGYVMSLKASGEVAEAASVAAQLALANPNDPDLLMLGAWQAAYSEEGDPLRIREWLERRGRMLAQGGAPKTFANVPDPERRLRVGFLCQDIRRDSPIARFVAPPLLHLDRARFELLGYCTQPSAEHMSPQLLGAVGGPAGGWLDVSNLDDGALAARIRDDGIDVLVETAGNTFGHRQSTLALRCAPVQVTCIGDPRTTGNPAIDYRIVDEITDPRAAPGAERFCTERLARLPGCFLSYDPHEDAPSARTPIDPACRTITFGSFNVHDKTGPGVIDLWSRILREVDGSRLLIKSLGLRSADLRSHFHNMFRARGIDPARVELGWEVPAMRDHLARYADVDIALDTFPYNGTTTTCDAMWMGVPVVTLLGTWHAARVGASLMTAVGLPELIARDANDYVRIASELARDTGRLGELHRTLRARMSASPLLNAQEYARGLGEAYRAMWRAWCEGQRKA